MVFSTTFGSKEGLGRRKDLSCVPFPTITRMHWLSLLQCLFWRLRWWSPNKPMAPLAFPRPEYVVIGPRRIHARPFGLPRRSTGGVLWSPLFLLWHNTHGRGYQDLFLQWGCFPVCISNHLPRVGPHSMNGNVNQVPPPFSAGAVKACSVTVTGLGQVVLLHTGSTYLARALAFHRFP